METTVIKTICIMCPMGCDMLVEKIGETYKVSGNTCKRGENYGIAEVTSPVRMVTSLVRYKDSVTSVKTSQPVPKGKIWEVLEKIKETHITKDVSCGDIIIKNVAETGADVIITGNI